jgi:hypothetical protein
MYYSNFTAGSWKSAETLTMTLERFRFFVRDTAIVNPRGKTCRSMNELDSVFVVSLCTVLFHHRTHMYPLVC